MNDQKKIQETLNQIARLATEAASDFSAPDNGSNGNGSNGDDSGHIGCSIKSLPKRLQVKAAEIAVKINPVNAPAMDNVMDLSALVPDSPQFLTLLTSKYWGATPRRLSVSFMESTSAALKKRIISHMNAWSKTTCISFFETSGIGQIRISFGPGGYYSYLGTDVLLIPKNRQTMNLQNFTMNTTEKEFIRVVRHETGHTLGFPHEHMRKEIVKRIDPVKAYAYFWATQGWNKTTVDQQVLTPLADNTIIGTPADQTSIMCYQLPASITFDNKPILGGLDINATDYAFAGKIYPKPGSSVMSDQHIAAGENDYDWAESEDVPDKQIEEVIDSTLVKSNGSEVEA